MELYSARSYYAGLLYALHFSVTINLHYVIHYLNQKEHKKIPIYYEHVLSTTTHIEKQV